MNERQRLSPVGQKFTFFRQWAPILRRSGPSTVEKRYTGRRDVVETRRLAMSSQQKGVEQALDLHIGVRIHASQLFILRQLLKFLNISTNTVLRLPMLHDFVILQRDTMSLVFGWDPRKARSNYRKHNVRFAEPVSVFSNPLARIFPDEGHSTEELREIVIGHSAAKHLLPVCFTEPETGSIRIISARRATRAEQHDYEAHVAK
jgi:uncharacterized DUF497 family protein